MKEYTVALNAEFVVTTDADALDCEDIAAERIEAALKEKADEVEVCTIKTYQRLFGGYNVKMAANMIVDVEADDYEVAYNRAVDVIEDIPYKDGVELVAIGTYDAALRDDKPFMLKPKFAF